MEPENAIPVRHPGRWAAAVAVAVMSAMLWNATVNNPRMEWAIVGQYLFDPQILAGLRMTLLLTVLAMAVGLVLGTVVAVMRMSENPLVRTAAQLYVWLFRSTPLIVQLLFWFYLAAVMPTLGLGIPFGPEWITFDTSLLISQITAAVLGLGLCEAAYTAEIVRAGILSVSKGQFEAGEALGMSPRRVLARIVLPQAMRVIVPPIGNSTISMLKTTALVLVIALPDLLTAAQAIYSQNLAQIPLLTVATAWYVFIVTVLTLVQNRIERKFSAGVAGVTRSRVRRRTLTAALSGGFR
ncbi:ABC transporter permease [Humibacillus sp. DSM 29435]|uniref:amino acid ABC transporter permease n=1 Tax=Humibacillus sp. DSM 29435 TaxID=1869167 RepID=UPI000871F237|nr:amino acid ABC transporter permease [Humibacillus sp. DSM 29435]OFE14402.1 ABC transporter permease [Humibacillus sp. DSM 29435]